MCTWSLQWHHNGHNGLSNHQPQDCLLNRLFRHRSKKTSKLRVTGLCAGNSLVTGEFPAQMASNAENVLIWWGHHDYMYLQGIKDTRPYKSHPIVVPKGVGDLTKPLPKGEIHNTFRLRQNGHHFADIIFKFIFLYENHCILIFPRVQLMISQHWFINWLIYALLDVNWVNQMGNCHNTDT